MRSSGIHLTEPYSPLGLVSKKKKKQKTQTSILANLLWTAAQIFSEMEFGKKFPHDTKMLRSFIHHDPPLHIRRTLDQFYFHTLDDTSARDCDQVVHRGTRGAKDHTRIIMVDQLWLWILDDSILSPILKVPLQS